MKKKLCFVIQRYGIEINGGAEAYCRVYAEKLADIYDISVVTTCALDYQKWENYYPEGTSVINGVSVHRFKNDCTRKNSFNDISVKVYNNPKHSIKDANDWLDAQGPVSSALTKYLEEHDSQYDLVFFFTYLYWPSAEGINHVKNSKTVLVPFCHDEPPVYLKCFDKLFEAPNGIIYNTDEEKDFILKRFGNLNIPSIMTGIGLDIPPVNSLPNAKTEFNLNKPFILYMGRIDHTKGCAELFDYFLEYKKRYHNDLQLVLMGKELIPIPKNKDIISLGFVSEEEKYAVLRECELFVLPSHFESLSIVVLEAFEFYKPILVSGRCEVLKGHCRKSNGGLYFYSCEDFCECLDFMINNKPLCDAMGKNGKYYVDKNYQWDIIIDKFTRFVDALI